MREPSGIAGQCSGARLGYPGYPPSQHLLKLFMFGVNTFGRILTAELVGTSEALDEIGIKPN